MQLILDPASSVSPTHADARARTRTNHHDTLYLQLERLSANMFSLIGAGSGANEADQRREA